MRTVEVLRARLAEIDAEYRTLHTTAGDQPLTEEQQTRWDELDTETTELRAELAKAEESEARAARVAESRARWNTLQVGATVPTEHVDPSSLTRSEARDRSLKRMDLDAAMAGLKPHQMEHVRSLIDLHTVTRDGEEQFDGTKIARRLLATENPAYRSAFAKALNGRHNYTSDEARALDEVRAASVGTTTAGGFGVPVLIDPTIVLTDQESLSAVRAISTVIPITTNVWKGVTSAGVSWSWDSEAAAVSDDAPTLAQPSITTYAARGFIPYSIEISQDYPNFASEFGRLLVEGYDELSGAAFVTGSTPIGIVTALDANTNVEVTPTTDGTFTATDIDKVWTALPDRAKRNATWLMSSDVSSYIGLWGDAYGGRTVDLAGVPTTLRGRPLAIDTNMPAFTGTTGAANILVVGNFNRYYIVERMGMTVEPVPMLFDVTNNMPTGQRGIFAMARVGADSIDDTSFRLLQNQ